MAHSIRKVGVIGAGQMGSGIAHVCALAGFDVKLYDVSADRIKQALALPIYEPKREEQVFANVVSNNNGPLPHDAVKRVFERIIDEMRGVQRNRMMEAQKAQAAAQANSQAGGEGNS